MKNAKYFDFFFGEYEKTNIGQPVLDFQKMLTCGIKPSPKYYTKQINRFLNENGGAVVVSHGTSYPEFDIFLDNLEKDEIGYLEISRRTDVNTNVAATLDCSIYFEYGILVLEPHWCARSINRANEVITTLITPLHLSGLSDKTFIDFEIDGVNVSLTRAGDMQKELSNVFSLLSYDVLDDSEFELNRHISNMNVADSVFEMGLTGGAALLAYSRQCKVNAERDAESTQSEEGQNNAHNTHYVK